MSQNNSIITWTKVLLVLYSPRAPASAKLSDYSCLAHAVFAGRNVSGETQRSRGRSFVVNRSPVAGRYSSHSTVPGTTHYNTITRQQTEEDISPIMQTSLHSYNMTRETSSGLMLDSPGVEHIRGPAEQKSPAKEEGSTHSHQSQRSPTMLPPMSIRRSRTPHEYRPPQLKLDPDDCVVPSEMAYLDQFIEMDTTATVGDYMVLNSFVDKIENPDTRSFGYKHTHCLRYKGQKVWEYVTACECDGVGTWGQSSMCHHIRDSGLLRVKTIYKGRTYSGEGWNTTEVRTYKLEDVVRASGAKAMKQLSAQ